MKKQYVILFAMALALLSACNSQLIKDSNANSVDKPVGVDKSYPKINISSDPSGALNQMLVEADTLIKLTGTFIACGPEPRQLLKAHQSPQHQLHVISIYPKWVAGSKHDQKTCYQIADMYAVRESKNSFTVNYSFISATSGESSQRKVGFVKLQEKWYLKNPTD